MFKFAVLFVLLQIAFGSIINGNAHDAMVERDSLSDIDKRSCGGILCACIGWSRCDEVVVGGVVNGTKYASVGLADNYKPEIKCVGGQCNCQSVGYGLVGCLD